MKKELERACSLLENLRLELYNIVKEHNRNVLRQSKIPNITKSKDIIILPPDKWKATCNDEIITIFIPDFMPRTKQRIAGVYERWCQNTKAAIWSLDTCPRFDKVFVYVKVFHPGQWDIDNRDIGPILNGIVRSRLVRDDTYNNIAYGMEGHFSENPHVVVHIFPYDNITKILPKIID